MNNYPTEISLIALFFWLSLAGILYTYFGYPLLITLLALFKQKPKSAAPFFPSVTLLIAAYNEETVIEDKIRNSLATDYPKDRFQIIIVTDGSSDSTPQKAGIFSKDGVLVLHQPERRGKMAAINRAMPFANGDFIIFSDANNQYQPDTIRKLITPFENQKIGAVSGAKIISQGDGSLGASEGLYWKYESFIKSQESRLGSCTSVAGEILAIRKNAYASPPNNIINDDFFIAMQVLRRGLHIKYVPDAKSIERVSPSANDEIIRRTRINAGRYQAIAMALQILPLQRPVLVWQIFSHKFLRPLVPFLMIGAALFNILAILYPPKINTIINMGKPFSIIMLSLQVIFYILAWIGTRLINQGNQSRLARLLYLPTFLTNSNFAALKGFIHFLRGQQTHLWERIQRR